MLKQPDCSRTANRKRPDDRLFGNKVELFDWYRETRWCLRISCHQRKQPAERARGDLQRFSCEKCRRARAPPG